MNRLWFFAAPAHNEFREQLAFVLRGERGNCVPQTLVVKFT
jgi:hypothetical protein